MNLSLCLVQPSVRILTHPEWLPELAKTVEFAGRLSHKSEAKIGSDSAHSFIQRIALGKAHVSILEHAHITVHARMSRAASHQLVRHRIAAYTQESQRYCDYASSKFDRTLEVICPAKLLPKNGMPSGTQIVAEATGDDYEYSVLLPLTKPESVDKTYNEVSLNTFDETFVKWARAVLRSYGHYIWLRDSGHRAEDARSLLPNATKTELVVTKNVRSWRHFFEMRCTKHAQEEIRSIASDLLKTLIAVAPWGFDDPIMHKLIAGRGTRH